MKDRECKDEKDIQVFAAFVHGALFGLHALGVVYNIKRKNWQAAAIHFTVGMWDCIATKNHMKEAEIIADAGKKNSVIITTSISGRGVDIKLGGNPEQSSKSVYSEKKTEGGGK